MASTAGLLGLAGLLLAVLALNKSNQDTGGVSGPTGRKLYDSIVKKTIMFGRDVDNSYNNIL